jgi:hypothetical protein
MGEMRNAHSILVGKSEGKRRLGKPRHRWEGDINMTLREIGREVMDWIHLAQVRDQWLDVVNMTMNFFFP